ncbi:MAG: glycerophosphodiester phosphodiesterase, partial [Pacificimonas sp.]
GEDTGLTAAAHDAGLAVHPWTFRAENMFMAKRFQAERDPREQGHMAQEICAFTALGIDGLFADHVALARDALRSCSAVE